MEICSRPSCELLFLLLLLMSIFASLPVTFGLSACLKGHCANMERCSTVERCRRNQTKPNQTKRRVSFRIGWKSRSHGHQLPTPNTPCKHVEPNNCLKHFCSPRASPPLSHPRHRTLTQLRRPQESVCVVQPHDPGRLISANYHASDKTAPTHDVSPSIAIIHSTLSLFPLTPSTLVTVTPSSNAPSSRGAATYCN